MLILSHLPREKNYTKELYDSPNLAEVVKSKKNSPLKTLF